jgi:hypothetical protein
MQGEDRDRLRARYIKVLSRERPSLLIIYLTPLLTSGAVLWPFLESRLLRARPAASIELLTDELDQLICRVAGNVQSGMANTLLGGSGLDVH